MDLLTDTVSTSVNTVGSTVTVVGSTVTQQAKEFYEFLVKNNIIQIGTAFIIGTQINNLATAFVDNIVSPVVVAISSKDSTKNLSQTYVEILGVRFQIGQFIMTLLKFMIMMLVLYYMFKIIGLETKK